MEEGCESFRIVAYSSPMKYALRTRFGKDIIAQFMPPARPTKRERVVILCDGMPTLPSKHSVLEFFEEGILGISSALPWVVGVGWVVSSRVAGCRYSHGNGWFGERIQRCVERHDDEVVAS